MENKFVKKKINIKSILIPLGVFLLMLSSLYDFQVSTNKNLRLSAYDILGESSARQIDAINVRLNGQYNDLTIMASYIERANVGLHDYKELDKILNSVMDVGDYTLTAVADKNGNAYYSNGETKNLGERQYFKDALDGKRGIEKVDVSKITNEPRVVISVPVNKNGKAIGAIVASFEVHDLCDLLTSDMYNKAAYTFIADSKGDIIARGENENLLTQVDNIFEIYKNSVIIGDENITIDTIMEDLAKGNKNAFAFKFSDNSIYTSYAPLGLSDWFLFSVVPSQAVMKGSAFMSENAYFLSGKFFISGLLILWYLISREKKRYKILAEDQELLRQSEEMYRIIGEMSDSIVFDIDAITKDIKFNKKFDKVFGRKPVIFNVGEDFDKERVLYNRDYKAFDKIVKNLFDNKPFKSEELRILNFENRAIWMRVEAEKLYDSDGKLYRILGKMVDVDDQKKEVEKLKKEAELDSLTKAYDHEAFALKVESFLNSDGAKGKHALFILDLDNFKSINDTFGHAEGDRILKGLVKNMRKIFRTSDYLGRLGGDEFAVFLKDIMDDEFLITKADELDALIKGANAKAGELNAKYSCSIGAAIYKDDGRTFKSLYKKADAALYAAKELGKNQCVLYKNIK